MHPNHRHRQSCEETGTRKTELLTKAGINHYFVSHQQQPANNQVLALDIMPLSHMQSLGSPLTPHSLGEIKVAAMGSHGLDSTPQRIHTDNLEAQLAFDTLHRHRNKCEIITHAELGHTCVMHL